MLAVGIALADDKPLTVKNVLSVTAVNVVKRISDLSELLLLIGHGHTLENAVVTAAKALRLVVGKYSVLGNFAVMRDNISGDSLHDILHLMLRDRYRSLRDDMTLTVTEQNLHCYLRIVFFYICQVDNGSGNAVANLVDMTRVTFFKHFLTSQFYIRALKKKESLPSSQDAHVHYLISIFYLLLMHTFSFVPV